MISGDLTPTSVPAFSPSANAEGVDYIMFIATLLQLIPFEIAVWHASNDVKQQSV